MNARIAGGLLIVLAIIIVATVAYRNSHKTHQPIVFSDRSMLDGLWNYHKLIYIDAQTGRTVDHARGNSSTSEGEGYEMLRAVWWDDKSDFDRAWGFTQTALGRQTDHLFSWYYSQLPNGKFGINTAIGAQNTASDADTDIALALIFAHDRWQDNKYLDVAKPIIQDIWKNEVVIINGRPYLAADDIEKVSSSPTIVVNPSYFAPYAYRIFAKYDPNDNWNALVDSSYKVLSSSMSSTLDKKSTDNLPPNWILINKTTGAITATGNPTLTTEYSFDAMRAPYRIALDYMWNNEPRAKQLLSQMNFLTQQWQQNQAIYTTYGHDGAAFTKDEAPSIYGGSIGYFMVNDPQDAQAIFNNKLKVLYTPDTNSWKQQLSYYDDTWAWLGMAMYSNFTINLEQPQNNG